MENGYKEWSAINDNRERCLCDDIDDDDGEGSGYDDIVYHNGKFYVLDKTGLLVSVDPVTLEITEFSSVTCGSGYGCGGLVKSYGNLFRIDKFADKFFTSHSILVIFVSSTPLYGQFPKFRADDYDFDYSSDSDEEDFPIPFTVYKLDEEKRDWVQVEELGDSVLFIGEGVSFSVSGKGSRGCKTNCVYYINNSYLEEFVYPGCDAGIFSLEDGASGALSGFPSYFSIFWPPRDWLKFPRRMRVIF
ncbi:F-box protein SKIP23-like [Hevea brasiliensis]|uniref:F-box protein SKIP23-like n=1 Tax=Hevea brasiliensis TaxID=3981 RepID=UPI0025EEA916|nr:F-box protein SKIP23-like [Hevea brasiliensis]